MGREAPLMTVAMRWLGLGHGHSAMPLRADQALPLPTWRGYDAGLVRAGGDDAA